MVHRALVGNHGMDNETSDLKTKKQKINILSTSSLIRPSYTIKATILEKVFTDYTAP